MTTISLNPAVNISVPQITNDLSSQKPKCYDQSAAKLLASSLPTPNETTNEIDNLLLGDNEGVQDIYCAIYIGYSGQSYEDFEGEMKKVKSTLEACVRDNQEKQIVVVCGGTSVGIGGVYDVVAGDAFLREHIKCIGIVSELASEEDLVQDRADFKVGIVRVPDPKKSWQTKLTDGDREYQAMLYPAHKYGGEVMAFGAGGIGYDEVKAAKEMGIKTTVFPSQPKSDLLEAKLKDGKEFRDVCPLLYHEFGFDR
ncbi:hypothetical protein [Pantoea sp.]|uniref:hypothetical protein n=1 Tax=Pantoea sp. TaxID=69393 RepID=UPI0028B05F17|nr:hypothetical protein [Pantoea sp.]